MKPAEQWAEEFPLLLPVSTDEAMQHWHTDEMKKLKKEYRERFINFIAQIQQDAKQ